jgi:hypothetical protein
LDSFFPCSFCGFCISYAQVSVKPQKTTENSVSEPKISDKEDRELSREDSEGDGLFFDDPLFPEEFEDE